MTSRVTKPQREKESLADYRYFPEPDLVPVQVDEPGWHASRVIGELPAARRTGSSLNMGCRLMMPTSWSSKGRTLPSISTRWPGHRRVQAGEQLDSAGRARTIKEKKLALAGSRFARGELAELITGQRGELNTNQGREVLGRMIETGDPAEMIIAKGGYQMVSDRDVIAAAVVAAIAANPQAIEDLKTERRSQRPSRGSSAARS